MTEKNFATFEEFWPYYVSEHAKKTTRKLHFVGTTGAMVCVAAALLGRPRWLLAAPFVGYGPAWIGHFFVEKNRPATFKYPVWSLRADLIMWGKTLAGTMDAEVDKVMAAEPAPASTGDGAAAQSSPDQTLN